MKRLILGSVIVVIVTVIPALAQQPTGVTAEAIGQANLRANTDVESFLVGEITSGTRYPVLARSEFYPWLLLGDPATNQPIGWVFAELVTVQGNLNSLPFSTQIVDPNAVPTSTPAPASAAEPTATQELVGVILANAPTHTPTPDLSNVIAGELNGEVNIRLGPGVEYDRIGVGRAGDRFEIVAWHTQLPWLQVRYPDSPNGYAWIARDLLDINGDVTSLPSLSQTVFNLPTLTPTQPVLQSSAILGGTPVPLSPEFAALGSRLWDIILSNGFDPATSRFGALFVMDLQTGEALAFGTEYAFSGTSIQKIAILSRLYGVLNAPPDTRTAINIANTMICSENSATNDLLRLIGNGNVWSGAAEVTRFERELGLQNTFITAPYTIPGRTPEPPVQAVELPTTTANQVKANADLSNQMTVDEMGQLLGSIYQCAYQNRGPLLERFGDQYEPRECRQMLHVMSNNTVDALLKAGVPEDTRVAHKHGWIEDTHGNAALFFTPGGDYVIVMMLFQPTWLNFQESLPVIAEVSRQVYNFYNPDAPLEAIREGFIPEAGSCNFAGSPLIDDLTSAVFDE
ncbi:MAG TPA: serine hydrolase [Spirillospora sp.]|nr:serine hydrolase [Spirillospora sp.]